jgi:hypothetical protein
MPRVTLPKPAEVTDAVQPIAPDIVLPVADEPGNGTPNVATIERKIRTVMIEVPICENPPDRVYTGAPYVAMHLTQSKTKTGRMTLHRLHWGLKEMEAKLDSGRPVRDRNDAFVWLIEQIAAAQK